MGQPYYADNGGGEQGTGIGQWPGFAAPPAYRAWGIVALICGVLFNTVLGFPAALIGRRYGRQVPGLWANGDVQAAVSASRKARGWLIASTVLDAIGIIALVVIVMNPSGSQSNYNNPSVVAASIKAQVQQRLSDKSGQYYSPGLTVKSVVCTPSGTDTDRCVLTLSTGQTVTNTAVISGNGTSYKTH